MCRRNTENNEPSLSEDELWRNLTDLRQAFSDTVRAAGAVTQEATERLPQQWETLWRLAHNGHQNNYRWPFGSFFGFQREHASATGISAYPLPSTEMYAKCQAVDGWSGWDGNGVWQCLFPRSTIPELLRSAQGLLTKEDAEAGEVRGDTIVTKNGLLFTSFEAYMRSRVVDEEQRRRRAVEARQEWWTDRAQRREDHRRRWEGRAEKHEERWGAREPVPEVAVAETPAATANPVVRTSTSTTYFWDNGDYKETTRVEKTFADGTSSVNEVVKTAPTDGSATSLPPRLSPGWFW